jgi:hypothetical protein
MFETGLSTIFHVAFSASNCRCASVSCYRSSNQKVSSSDVIYCPTISLHRCTSNTGIKLFIAKFSKENPCWLAFVLYNFVTPVNVLNIIIQYEENPLCMGHYLH